MILGAPWMLLLLPLVALSGWLMRRSRRLQRRAACQLEGSVAQTAPVRLAREDWLALAALACVVAALARPQWNPRPYDIQRRGRDLIVALDVSRSMLAADTFPSRLEMARINLLEALPAFKGQRMALITFAGSASVRVPLTLDHGFIRYVLERAGPSDEKLGSTSLQAAFEKVAGAVLADATASGRDLVVFTDGEDHLSDLRKTAELLARCGARVLIVGLGDPALGARVPDPRDESQWMVHNQVEVVSRLQEDTLTQFAAAGSNVTYFPARTRPFDLLSLYRQWIAGASGDVVVGGVRQVRYSEGYPYLLALAVVLWLASSARTLPKRRSLALLAAFGLLVPGCTPRAGHDDEAAFRSQFDQASELLKSADEKSGTDPFAEQSLLSDAREKFLAAALLEPGHVITARQITAITRRLHQLESTIARERTEEKQRGEKLTETIGRLQQLVAQQKSLAQQCRRMLGRVPVPSGEEANLPDPSMDDGYRALQEELDRSAPPIAAQLQPVREGTADVLKRITDQRDKLRQILTRAYGNVDNLPPTEVDPIVDLLAGAVAAQDEGLARLAPGAVAWPQANTALHAAAGRMEQALEALRSLQPPATEDQDDTAAARNAGDYDESLDGLDSDSTDSKSQSAAPADFQEALLLRSLPIPDDTSAEILAEEAANQEKRARQKAVRAGAKVEKNW